MRITLERAPGGKAWGVGIAPTDPTETVPPTAQVIINVLLTVAQNLMNQEFKRLPPDEPSPIVIPVSELPPELTSQIGDEETQRQLLRIVQKRMESGG